MMNNLLIVDLFKVSGDSKYLDAIFECPVEYYFDSLELEVKFVDNGSFKSKHFDLSPALFSSSIESSTANKKRWVLRIPLDKLNIFVPAIYIATLHMSPMFITVINNGTFRYSLPFPYVDSSQYEIRYNSGANKGMVYEVEGDSPLFWNDGTPVTGNIYTNCCSQECTERLPQEVPSETIVCSDVNYAYRCMLDELMMKAGGCEDLVSDEVIRKYLLLYGHVAAMSTRDMETAEAYFKLIGNCFNVCGNPGRGEGSCCGTRDKCVDRPIRSNHHSCNCGR